MFRKQFNDAALATVTMGSGSSKKAPAAKRQQASAKSAASSTSSESNKSGTAVSVSTASKKPAETTGPEQPVKNSNTSGQSASSGTESKSQETTTMAHDTVNKQLQNLTLQSQVMGALVSRRKVSKWQEFNIDDLMQMMGEGEEAKQWYDIVDKLINTEKPVITPNTKRTGWRTVRLFISSTFRDMHSEREHLIRAIIPVLRQWCEERKLHLIECDLRWGVPKDADTRETLLTCLSEIDRCREENEYPYFLSMLSERYGYVMDPEAVPTDIKARYKWLPGMSLTSLEIMTGAYWDNNPNALFMMRKPNFLERVDEDIKHSYVESDPEAMKSLSVLKEKVKAQFPGKVVQYDCSVDGREGKRMVLGNLDKFGQTILEYFKVKIAEQYPEISAEQEMSEMEVRHADQEEFIFQRAQVLLGRDEEMKAIDKYIRSEDKTTGLLALVGYPGAGKSSMMANCAKLYLNDPKLKVFFHFVGVSPDSTSAFSILSRIYRECMPADQQESMPLDPDDMMRFTPTMFQEASKEAKRGGATKLVIFIDALNQMDDTGGTHKLAWLPRQLPEGLRVVVSTLEGLTLDSLRNHASPAQEVAVNPLNETTRKCMAEQLLQTYNKRLDGEQMDILVKKMDAGRPLYLSIACEELRVFGEFRHVTNKIRTMSSELAGLVETVLQRVVEEFGGDMVQAALCLIETSRYGLEEEELLYLLSVQPALPSSTSDCLPSDFKQKLPMAVWGFVYVGLRSFLRPSGAAGEGRVDFYHRTTSKVVRKKYLSDLGEAAKWHGRLIQFFSGSSNIVRKAEELPFHYIATNNIEGLRRCLLTREMFEHLYTERSKQTLMQYWQVAGGYQLAAESYKKALQDFLTFYHLEDKAEGEELSTKVAWFLVDIGEYDAANQLLSTIISNLSKKYGAEAVELADPLHATMMLLMQKGLKYVYGSHPGYQECVRKGRQLVDLTVKVHRKKFPPNSNKLGNVLSLCGYFKSSLLNECRSIFEKNNNKVGLAVVLFTMGEKEQYNDDMNVPISLFKEALALCKVYFGIYHLSTARCVQLYGQLFWNRWTTGHKHAWLEESLTHYTMELDILQEILGPEHPTTVRSREDVIIILQNLNRHAEANKFLAQQPQSHSDIA